jgi:RNA polymerase sigma factor (TIGR02999 family)
VESTPSFHAPPSFTDLYPDLRVIARARLRAGRDTLLDTTSLVHECYIRLAESGGAGAAHLSEFLHYASRTMRNIIIDSIRRRCAARRGGGAARPEFLEEACACPSSPDEQILSIHDALTRLEVVDSRLARVVEMRYFGGLTESEIAAALGVTERTVRRDWQKARLLLANVLSAPSSRKSPR